jgi:hypothetical protein
MIFFFSIINQDTQIDCIAEGKFINYEGEQIAILRKNCIDILIVKKNNGKILFATSSNFFKANISIKSFSFKDHRISYLAILDKNGECSLAFFKKSGKIFVSSKKKLKVENYHDFKKFSVASLNLKFLLYLVSSFGSITFFLSIEKNPFNQPIFSKKSIKIKKSKTICFSLVNLEDNSKNVFATIETNYNRPYDKFLIYYEINLCSQIIERKIISKISNTSYMLIPLGNITKKESLFICSEKVVTLIDFEENKHRNIKIPISKKKKAWTNSSFFSSYTTFVGFNHMFYIFSDQYGNIFQLFLNNKSNLKYTKRDFRMRYIDNVDCLVSSMFFFSNGFLFLGTSSGNHLYFQFLTLPSVENSKKNFFFYPSRNLKHLKLIDEMTSFSPLISIEFLYKTKKQNLFMFLLCGSNSRSSIRILKNSCKININGFTCLRNKPIGIFILKKKNFFSIFTTYHNYTSQFFFRKNFVETVENFFISDGKTLNIELLNRKNRIIQITSEKIRLVINKNSKKKKIIDWIPGDLFIINSSSFIRTNSLHYILFLSNKTCVLIGLGKNDVFIELQTMVLKTFNFFSLFGISLNSNYEQNWDFMVLFSGEEKLVRVFSLNSKNFLVLMGIYFLPFYPQSAKIFMKIKETYIIIGLKNGLLLIGKMNSKNGKIEKFDFLKISDSPVFISPKPIQNGIILFGNKIWHLKINKNKTIDYIRHEKADFVEIFQKFLLVSRKKTLKIFKIKKKIKNFSVKEKFLIKFTPYDFIFSNLTKRLKYFFITFNQEPSNSIFHNSIYNQKKKKKSFYIRKEGISTQENLSGLSVISFNVSKKGRNSKTFFSDNLKIRGSSGDKIISGMSFKNYLVEKNKVLFISMIDFEKDFSKNIRFDISKEQDEPFYFLAIFSIKKTKIYDFVKGGRKYYEERIYYLFEKYFSSVCNQKPIFYVKNIFIGNRNILCKDNFILIVELMKKKIENLLICLSSLTKISDVDSKLNYIIVADIFRGLKLFKFCQASHKFLLCFEDINETLIRGCKILNLSLFSIFNKMGCLKFFRINYTRNHKISNTKMYFSIIFCIDLHTKLTEIKPNFTKNKSQEIRIFVYSREGFFGVISSKENKTSNFYKKFIFSLREKTKVAKKFHSIYENSCFDTGIIYFLKRLKQRFVK